MAYYIGTTEFDDLRGDIPLPTPSHDVEARAGQDGVVVFSTGTRGREFELRSDFHVSTYLSAVTLKEAYESSPSITPYNIIRDTEDYTSKPIRFLILGVAVSIVPKLHWTGLRSSGRINLTPAYAVEANWRMIAVAT